MTGPGRRVYNNHGMKICVKCEQGKSAEEFRRHSRSSDGLQSYCKTCANEYQRDYNTKWRKRVRTELDTAKDVPCVECGNIFPPECMDFDHVRGEKLFAVGLAIRSPMSWDRLLREIEKCEVVCSNCHRIRTKARRLA